MPDSFWAAAVFALVLRGINRSLGTTALLLLPGTICHELAHWITGWALLADPEDFSVRPHREARAPLGFPRTPAPGGAMGANRWILGSVTFRHITWYNGLFVGLAPLGLIPAAWWCSRQIDWNTAPLLAIPWFYGTAALLGSGIPSSADWQIAFRSWPFWLFLAGWVLLHA
ncbi:hypothetical protein [Thiomonas sp.]